MNKGKQVKTPFFDALVTYNNDDIVPFDVPGHKRGRLVNEFTKEVGLKTMELDVNLPRGLDNLNNPVGVIKEAEELLADAYSADYGFFLVDGSTVGILTMILAVVGTNDVIIMPRNVHKSAISGLILAGAKPVFVCPEIDQELGIANAVSFEAYAKAIDEHPEAKAVFIIHPTYFGVVGDACKIIAYAHEHNMVVIADEAHGAHFAFSRLMPKHAIACGADLVTSSLHKTGGSLTQSSILLMNENKYVSVQELKYILSMLQTTSPNALLLASLDVARKVLAMEGPVLLRIAVELSDYACKELNKLKGIVTYNSEYFKTKSVGVYKHDPTKLIIKVTGLGLTGFDVYKMMKDEYHIQLELAESYVVLAIISIGTTKADIEKLIKAFTSLWERYFGTINRRHTYQYHDLAPVAKMRPRDAYNSPKKFVRFKDCVGCIAAEAVMAYPPGIPIVIPGEEISKEMLKAMYNYRKEGTTLITQFGNGFIEVVDCEQLKEMNEHETQKG